MTKIYAIMGGGDWADASVGFVVGEVGFDLEKEKQAHAEYDEARNQEMRKSQNNGTMFYVRMKEDGVRPYISLEDWLLSHGGRKPTNDEVEEVWER